MWLSCDQARRERGRRIRGKKEKKLKLHNPSAPPYAEFKELECIVSTSIPVQSFRADLPHAPMCILVSLRPITCQVPVWLLHVSQHMANERGISFMKNIVKLP